MIEDQTVPLYACKDGKWIHKILNPTPGPCE